MKKFMLDQRRELIKPVVGLLHSGLANQNQQGYTPGGEEIHRDVRF